MEWKVQVTTESAPGKGTVTQTPRHQLHNQQPTVPEVGPAEVGPAEVGSAAWHESLRAPNRARSVKQ